MTKIWALLLIFSFIFFHNESSFAAKKRSQSQIAIQKKKKIRYKQSRTKSRQPKSPGYSKAAQYLQNNEPQALIEE